MEEVRRHNKTQTLISHIHPFELPAKEMAEILQKMFAASASTFEVAGVAGKSKPLGVSVQGSWVKEIVNYLHKQCGVPRKYIKP